MQFKLFISILLFSSHMIEEATELQKYTVLSFLKVCIIRYIAIPLQWRIVEDYRKCLYSFCFTWLDHLLRIP